MMLSTLHSLRGRTIFSGSRGLPALRGRREADSRLTHVRLFATADINKSGDGAAASATPSSSRRRFVTTRRAVLVLTASTLFIASYQVRQWRNKEIQELPLVIDESVWSSLYPSRSLSDVIDEVSRIGLMGTTSSVMTELENIRRWHTEHGYKGGIVLRDLTKPVFVFDGDDCEDEWGIGDILEDPTRLARRECYYLYYEIKGTGEVKQQIFCRGTTLGADVLTCLETFLEYDQDLQCRVHRGFLNQANRILKDVLPLLAPPSHRRATVEVCGHSLGGAVAAILAVKLRKKGYRVVRLTTVAEPRFCGSASEAEQLLKSFPKDHLRVEDDSDFVPFLPPFGTQVGNKLWFVSDGSARFVAANSHKKWTDSVFINFRLWDIVSSGGQPHRIPNYLTRLKKILSSGS